MLKDNPSSNFDPNAITWEEVYVTDNPRDAEGLIAVKSITESSGWSGSVAFNNCVKAIQQKAAEQGCCLAVITNISHPFFYEVTATLYKRP